MTTQLHDDKINLRNTKVGGNTIMECMVNVNELRKIMIDNSIYSISELALLSGVNRNALGNIFNRKVRPSTKVVDKLMVSLNIPPDKAGYIFFNQNLRNEKVL